VCHASCGEIVGFVNDVRFWRDGAKHREKALASVMQSECHFPR
jgi:hypothetical protein